VIEEQLDGLTNFLTGQGQIISFSGASSPEFLTSYMEHNIIYFWCFGVKNQLNCGLYSGQ
jgi:polyhydroxyalkanoate synthesis regulator protein